MPRFGSALSFNAGEEIRMRPSSDPGLQDSQPALGPDTIHDAENGEAPIRERTHLMSPPVAQEG
eukprot:13532611-Alexandrium_andersonii.AAC.1